MVFPNKEWKEQLALPVPQWATHQIDFTNSEPESYSVWIGRGYFQYFRGTAKSGFGENANKDDENFDHLKWKEYLEESCSYVKVIDLQPIEENE